MHHPVNSPVVVKKCQSMVLLPDSLIPIHLRLAQIGPFFLEDAQGLLCSTIWRDKNNVRTNHPGFPHFPARHPGLLFSLWGNGRIAVATDRKSTRLNSSHL